MMRIPLHHRLVTPGGLALSDPENAEALADSLWDQYLPVKDPSVPVVIEVVNEAMQAYSYTPAIKPLLTSPAEFHLLFRVSKSPRHQALNHLPLSVVSLLVVLFNAILRTQ
jgi:hypothetical protein